MPMDCFFSLLGRQSALNMGKPQMLDPDERFLDKRYAILN